MSRRIVPGTFWVGILACALLLPGTTRAARPFRLLPNVQGIWDGFFIAADGETGPVRSDITEQRFQRIAGNGLIDRVGGDVAYRFRATLARPDFLTGTGVTRTGRLVFQADLATFAGLGGDAGVMTPEYHFVPSRRGKSRISALLLHPFPGIAPPDIAGSYEGPFISLPDPITGDFPDPTFRGTGRMQISPRNARGSFAGSVRFFHDSGSDPFISWPFLATTSDNGRVIWISQGAAGRIVYDGVVIPAPDKSVSRIDGFFRLIFNDGRSLFNAYNCSISR
jgi:hypothetical protein